MPAPALKIPVSVDLNSLKQQMDQGAQTVGNSLVKVGQQFYKLNNVVKQIAPEIAQAIPREIQKEGLRLAARQSLIAAQVSAPWVRAAAFMGLPFLAALGAVAASFAGLGFVIAETRRQLEEMVKIADKASKTSVSPEFFQKFTSVSRELRVSTEDLEGALNRAFEATKGKAPIDLEKWDFGKQRITEVEKLLQVLNVELEKSGKTLEGVEVFRSALTQQERIEGVLRAMVQLNAEGRKLESLQLGEALFGSQFVDNIRRGATSAEQLLETIQRSAALTPSLFSDEVVRRAKEVDDELKRAHNTLEENLKPAWNDLALKAAEIKSLWAGIVNFIAQAAGLLDFFGPARTLERLKSEFDEINKRLEAGNKLFGLIPLGTDEILKRRKAEIEQAIGELERLLNLRTNVLGEQLGLSDIGRAPTTPRPTLRPEPAAGSGGRFDSAVESIEKRTAATVAETAAIDLGTEARARAKITAELETIAKQVNTEAGINNGQVTEEQRKKIDELALAYSRAAKAAEDARSPLSTFIRESADLNKQLNQFGATSLATISDGLAGIVTGAKTAEDAFKQMATSIINDLARIALRAAVSGIVSSIFGVPAGAGVSIFAPGNASGTDSWRGGWTWVGEKGPELINVPRGSQIVPNDVATSGGVGQTNVGVTATVVVQGDVSEKNIAMVTAAINQLKREIPTQVASTVRNMKSRNIK